jgi:hypothetical protein
MAIYIILTEPSNTKNDNPSQKKCATMPARAAFVSNFHHFTSTEPFLTKSTNF